MAELIFRPGTWDEDIWRCVASHNEYRLRPDVLEADDSVLDIGAHIGAFAYTVLDRGAGRVVCVEPDPGNFHLLRHNLLEACCATDRAVLVSAAAGGMSRRRDYLAGVAQNTGGANSLGSNGLEVASVPLHCLIDLAIAWNGLPLRLLKLDCEGAEWEMLEQTDLFYTQAVVGEYHEIPDPSQFPAQKYDGPRDRDWLESRLCGEGFAVATRPTGHGLGLFWAWRPGQDFADL